jgi:hypothetical protein
MGKEKSQAGTKENNLEHLDIEPELTKAEMLKQLLHEKKVETAAKARRNALEEKIEKLYGDFEGLSKTFNEDELGYKVVIKKSITSSLDQDRYRVIRKDIDSTLRPEKITYAIDSKAMDFLKSKDKESYNLVKDCIVEKEGKTSITVEKK